VTAPPDAVRVAWRAERRRAARDHHPDVGGDPQEYLRVITAIDARYGLCVDPGGAQRPTRARTTTRASRLAATRRAARRWVHRTARLTRNALPTWRRSL
jgi:hypothetical protein